MKPHLQLRLAPGVARRDVGSWPEFLADAAVAGPPFEPSIDRTLSSHRRVDAAIVRDFDPVGTSGWSPAERANGLDRQFRIIGMNGLPFDLALVDALRRLDVVERCDPAQLAEVTIPLATSMARAPSRWAGDVIGLDEAHRITTGHPDVTIAVLDTGVQADHPEYSDRLVGGFDFVDIIDDSIQFLADKLDADPDPTDPGVGHGSHVTGIVVAKGKRMLDGVAPRCRVLPVRVLGALRQGDRLIGAGLVDNINAGIRYAVEQGADVINMSLGIQHEGGGLPHVDVIRAALAEGVSVVAAAGNDGTSTLYYPGALPGVIAVGAVDQDGQVAHYSTWGDQVDLVAPGTEIYSTWLDGGYGFATGTSQATPFVAGALALCQSLARASGTRLTPRQLAEILRATCDRAGQRFKDRRAGYGRLNLPDALALTQFRLDNPRTTRDDRRVARRPLPVPALA
jgi:subtilisin family serine protease